MKPPIVLIASIALLLPAHLRAQERFLIGVTAGLSSTHLSGDISESGSYTSTSGFSAGVIGEYALTKDIHLSVQPSYARRGTGAAFDVGEEVLRDSLELAVDYLSIPVIARFLMPGGVFFINGGLDLSFLLDAELDDVNAGTAADVRNLVNDLDVTMIFGVGGSAHLKPFFLSVELRYGQSLVNAGANDQLAAAVGISPRFRFSGFQLLLTTLYPL